MGNEDLLARRVEVTRRIVRRHGDIGKTKIQKIVYFLQEALDVPLMYPFRMHYYGPYSDDLDGTLSLTKSLGYIDIDPDPNGFGYHVTSVEERENMSWQEYDLSGDPETQELTESIDEAIDILGRLDTPQIELYATIHFISGLKANTTKEQALQAVKRLKPKFSVEEISHSYQSLQKANLI